LNEVINKFIVNNRLDLSISNVRGQTGKGANLTLFGGAFMACVAGGQTG
jgi:hypothetical protein